MHCLRPTVRVVRLAEVQVVAGPGRVVLGAHGELHALDVLFEVVEGSEDVLHSLHAHAIDAVVRHRRVALHLSLPPGLSARLLDGEWLDDVTGWSLKHRCQGKANFIVLQLNSFRLHLQRTTCIKKNA